MEQSGWSRRNLLVALAGGGLLAAGRPGRSVADTGLDCIADEDLARKLGLDIPSGRLGGIPEPADTGADVGALRLSGSAAGEPGSR